VLNESPVDKQGFPKTSEVEFRGFLRDPEVTEPAGETVDFAEQKTEGARGGVI
jgi:hypothetical protein